MSGCEIIPASAPKACSGKCRSGGCNAAPKIWVVAACEGMISLFEKDAQETLLANPHGKQSVFPSLDAFRQSMNEAENTHAFDQLIIIGSSNDIAWIHASLPAFCTRHIVAEIECPLIPEWFKETGSVRLAHALQAFF